MGSFGQASGRPTSRAGWRRGGALRAPGRRFVPAVEMLEDRLAPATFGVPWSDPTHLTLSFVPDKTPVADGASALFQTLNASAATSAWETAILRAFQTWAVQANINIGVVADSGLPLGTPGMPQGDPRFGDIRIA